MTTATDDSRSPDIPSPSQPRPSLLEPPPSQKGPYKPRVGWAIFPRLIFRAFFQASGTTGRLTLRRFFTLFFALSGFLLLQVFHRLGFLLDAIFFPGWKDVPIQRPTFILGLHRGGTTFFHTLLAKDEAHVTTFRMWELFLAPAVSQKKLFLAFGQVDRFFGSPLRKLIEAIEARTLTHVRRVHPTGFFAYEEDELVLLHNFASGFIFLGLPFLEELAPLLRFDAIVVGEARARVMGFYQDCVKRHLYTFGAHKRFLSKNPLFSIKVDSLLETFPDAQIICCVRNPYQAIPSYLSLMHLFWRLFDNDTQGWLFRDTLLELADEIYRHPLERLQHLPPSRHAFMRYHELVADTEKAVLDLYARFGWTLSPEYQQLLAHEKERERRYRSRHEYSLEQFGLSPDYVLERYRFVFDAWRFDTAFASSGDASRQTEPRQVLDATRLEQERDQGMAHHRLKVGAISA